MDKSACYPFTFQYELIGNPSDFNHILQAIARDFQFIHWLSEDWHIQPLRSFIIRKKDNQKCYRLLKHQQRDLEWELKALENYLCQQVDVDQKQMQIEKVNKEMLIITMEQITEVIGLINREFLIKLPTDESLQFLRIQQLLYKDNQKQKFSNQTRFYSILLHRIQQEFFQQVSKEIKLKNLIIVPESKKCYEFQITIKSSLVQLQPSLKQAYRIQQIYGIKILKIDFIAQDKTSFFKTVLKIDGNPFSKDIYQFYDDFFPPGKIKVPYREENSTRRKQFKEKHYSLAFQGGGAKGLAYVGAYKALKQNEAIYQKKGRRTSIPITSIMGSSAGGMISLAVSTGISYRELQKICFKMKDIPRNDSFRKKNSSNTNKGVLDQKGQDFDEQIELTEEQVFGAIKKVLSEYGILTQKSFDTVKQTIERTLGKIVKPLMRHLSIQMPSIGDILRNEDDTLNLQGLLVKGALMKGDAVHDIGVQCLIRYFLKIYYQSDKEELRQLLDDCFSAYRHKNINYSGFNDFNISEDLMTCLQLYHLYAKDILNLSIEKLAKIWPNRISQFLVSVINNLILTILENEQQRLKKANKPEPRDTPMKDIKKEIFKSFKWATLKKVFQVNKKSLEATSLVQLQKVINQQTATLWDIIYSTIKKNINQQSQYYQLKMAKAQTNLLPFQFFDKSNENCSLTIKQFIQQLFGEAFGHYFQNIQYIEHGQSAFKLQETKLPKFDLQIAQIIVQSFQMVIKQSISPQQVLNFLQNKRNFAQKVKDITMIQYYMLTNVQLTCTSVDLDDKILRLFNKKTTPYLPVCKAVQMSGSFPAAFKAQKWKKNWGNYNIYYKTYKAEINLTNHEFTDGGLLANFPIRYLDNKDLCKKYFSHVPNSLTTILGFGLDYIGNQDSQATMNMKEIYQFQKDQQKKNVISQQFTLKTIVDSIGLLNIGKVLYDVAKNIITGNQKQQVIDWTDINHAILKEVPLIRFLLKLLDAYPNSDRNFNVETFTNRVLHQNIYQKWKNKYQLYERECREVNLSVVKIKNILTQMKKKEYKPTLNMKEKPLSEYVDPAKEFQELILNKCQEREKEIIQRVQIKKRVLQRIMHSKVSLINLDPWIIKNQKKLSTKMVKKMIIILMMLIRQAPHEIRKQLTLQYLNLKRSNNYQTVDNPLDYDISQSLKRMVQYIYLKLVTKDCNQQKKLKYIQRVFHNSFEQLLEILNSKEQQAQQLLQKFNYQSVKKQAKAILKRIIDSPHFKVCKNGKLQLFWNENFVKYISKIIQSTFQENQYASNARLYCQVSFLQNYFIKSQNLINQQQYDAFFEKLNKKDCTQYFQEMESNIFQYFQQDQAQKLKSAFVYEAENIYNQNLQEINQILLKQLSRRGIQMMNNLKKNKRYNEVRGIMEDDYKYLLLKLIRAVTYYRKPEDGWERFTIKQRKQIENALLTIFFGKNRLNYGRFQVFLKFLSARTQDYYKSSKKQINQLLSKQQKDSNNNLIYLECYFLRFLQRLVLLFVIANKITHLNKEQQKYVAEDAREMLHHYQYFTNDISFIINCIKQCNIILSEMVLSQNIKGISFLYPENSATPQNCPKITIKYQNIHNTCQKVLYSVVNEFIKKSIVLSIKPNNTINMTHLEQAFMIRYQLVKSLLNRIYFPLKYRSLQLKLQQKSKDNSIELKYISFILSIFDKLTYHKYSIPLFQIDWKLTLKNQRILKVVDNKIMTTQSFFAKKIKFIVWHQNKQKQKIQLDRMPKIHLILQGVRSSNQYYCTILDVARDAYKVAFENQNNLINSHTLLMIPSQKVTESIQAAKHDESLFNQNDPNLTVISAVTSSNFHVMFGFLLSTNASMDKVKRQIYHLKRISQECEEDFRIEKYFQSYQWLNQCTNQYKQLLRYLEKQRSQFFEDFQDLKERNFSNDSLQSEYQYIKSYFKNETQIFVQNYDKILQQISKQVQIVDGKYKPTKKPRQICRRFALNYLEQFQEKISYNYSKINQQVLDKLKTIVHIIYDTFGNLVEGVFCTVVSRFGAITINDFNAKNITKGIIVKRLLSTFQLKEYITDKLKQLHLSPSITLSKFYDSAPRPVFLNLCAINMNKERLQFLNKQTMPFMPVWAAILASTALPFLYNYFSARQEWNGVEQRATFYSLIVEDFFKTTNKTNFSINYCSSNYISSLPLQIMTNKAVIRRLNNREKVKKDKQQDNATQQLVQFALAFSNQYQDDFRSLKVTKKYLNFKKLLPLISKSLFKVAKKYLSFRNLYNLWNKKKQKQDGTSYWKKYLNSISKIGNVANAFSTLVNSNDNFVLQWYRDQLIKLPIKIGTLDFHLIVDKEIQEKHRIRLLSQKAKQTVQRSYEITKKFTSYLTQQGQQKQANRYRIKMRFQMVYFKTPEQFVYRFAKLTILNHSKWNQNMFNNFSVHYKVVNISSFTQQFQKASESEILWNIQSGSKIQLKFYFPYIPIHIPQNKSERKQSQKLAQRTVRLSVQQIPSEREQSTIQPKQQKLVADQLSKVHYTRWKIDFRKVLDQIYNKSSVKAADTFQFEFDYLYGHDKQDIVEITPNCKKNSIYYEQLTIPVIYLENISYNEQRKNKINIDQISKRQKLDDLRQRDNKMESVYISEWIYPFSEKDQS